MLGLIHCIKKCDQGATAVEYSLIASLIVITIILALTQVSKNNMDIWNKLSDKIVATSK
jgi:Flp pilus assembly pilin Flp